jgi:predicted transcriptional regulator
MNGRENMKKRVGLGELEFDVLSVLWSAEKPIKLKEAFYLIKNQPKHKTIKYSTVATVLQRLVNKKVISKRNIEKIYHYQPVLNEKELLKQRLNSLVENFFAGNMKELLSYIIREQIDFDPEEIKKLISEIE